MNIKGLLVTVYRAAHGTDTTNGGVSSQYPLLILEQSRIVDCSIEHQSPDAESRTLVLEAAAGGKGTLIAVPKELSRSKVHYTFGGNYITTSDSRFPFPYPIPVHDRVEQ